MGQETTQQQRLAANRKSKFGILRRYLPLLIILAAAGLCFAMGWHHHLSLKNLAVHKETLEAFVREHYLLAIFGFAVLYILVVALSLPVASFLTIFGGVLFGALLSCIIVVISATIGALIVFLAARTSLGATLQDKAGPSLSKLREGFNDNAMSYLLFLRLVPVFPFWLVNIAPALLGVRTSTFIIGTLIGIIPGTFAFAFVGAGLDSVIEAQAQAYQDCLASQQTSPQTSLEGSGGAEGGHMTCALSLDTTALLTPQLLIAFALLGVVALIPVVWKKVQGRG